MSFEHYAQLVIDFVRVHHAWAAPVVFALAFLESMAFVSFLITGWAALVGIGALIGASGMPFWPVWVAGAMGSSIGFPIGSDTNSRSGSRVSGRFRSIPTSSRAVTP